MLSSPLLLLILLHPRQHYDPENEEGRNVYLALLKVYMLEPSGLDAPKVSELKSAAARLLDKCTFFLSFFLESSSLSFSSLLSFSSSLFDSLKLHSICQGTIRRSMQ